MKKSIKETVRDAVSPTITELGYDIWDITYSKVGADYHLEITIDSPNGINIEDCEKVHRAIDPILDEVDPIEGFYYLDVSSPGIERELKTAAHVEACEGWDVEVKLYAPKNGSKMFRGVLCGYDEEGSIVVEVGENKLAFKPDEVAKIATYYDFGN